MASMKKGAAVEAAHAHFPEFLRSRSDALVVRRWMEGRQYDNDIVDLEDRQARFQGRPFQPSQGVEEEYEEIAEKSPTPWAGLVVASLQQTAHLEGIRRRGSNDMLEAWDTFRRNRWHMKQNSVHRAAIGEGQAFGIVLPGRDPLTGDRMAKMGARSMERMSAFYDNDDDEWCMFAIEAEKTYDELSVESGWLVSVWDEYRVHRMSCKGNGVELKDWTYIDYLEHPSPVPPVARLANRLDLEGRATGEIEPVIPLLRRIDQDVFDRLIVQRYGAWQVRYIAGMAKPTNASEAMMQAIRLRQEDFLVSSSEKTKFGVLPGGPIEPFEKATDADLRMLAAVTQTPPHHLLGLSSNLQAEALAAAEAGLQRKSQDFRLNASEFHEQMARLCAVTNGNRQEAAAYDMQVRWADTESRSFTQTAQALAMLATNLAVPVEMLWEKVPGWTDEDTERAKALVEDATFQQLLQEFGLGTGGPQQASQEQSGGDSNDGA